MPNARSVIVNKNLCRSEKPIRAALKKFKPALVFLLTAFVLIITFSVTIYHWRPLIPTDRLSVSFTNGGKQRPAKVFKILFRPDWVFIRLPDNADKRYTWFALDLRQKCISVPNAPHSFPYLCFNPDMGMGVMLKNVKIQDDWKVQWENDKVRFNNNKLSILITNKIKT